MPQTFRPDSIVRLDAVDARTLAEQIEARRRPIADLDEQIAKFEAMSPDAEVINLRSHASHKPAAVVKILGRKRDKLRRELEPLVAEQARRGVPTHENAES